MIDLMEFFDDIWFCDIVIKFFDDDDVWFIVCEVFSFFFRFLVVFCSVRVFGDRLVFDESDLLELNMFFYLEFWKFIGLIIGN